MVIAEPEEKVHYGDSKKQDDRETAVFGEPVFKNFAPKDGPEGDNEVHYDAHIGGGYHIKLQTWNKNSKKYFCLRKATTGANLEIQYYKNLKKALEDMEDTCGTFLDLPEEKDKTT